MISKIIIDMCRLSAVAYFDQTRVLEQYNSHSEFFSKFKDCPKLIEGDLSHDHSIIQNDCQVYSCKYYKSLVFAFRGTESFRDVLSDLNLFRSELEIPGNHLTSIFSFNFNRPLVHSGFLTQFNTVKDEINQDIIEYRKDPDGDNHLIFTGHSLGGALATIASVYYGSLYPDMSISCITFGSPRVGNRDFAKIFNSNITESHRFVNEDDPVPMGPTPIRFSHVEGGHWIKDEKLVDKKPMFRTLSFVASFIGSIFGIVSNPVSDHNCDHYLDVIECCDNKN